MDADIPEECEDVLDGIEFGYTPPTETADGVAGITVSFSGSFREPAGAPSYFELFSKAFRDELGAQMQIVQTAGATLSVRNGGGVEIGEVSYLECEDFDYHFVYGRFYLQADPTKGADPLGSVSDETVGKAGRLMAASSRAALASREEYAKSCLPADVSSGSSS